MGMMDDMMESMIGGMTKEEKQEIMSKMMEMFFSGMTTEDKQKMMQQMMPKMMEGINMAEMMPRMMIGMMGGNSGGTPMGMMSKMMGGGQAPGTPMMGHMMTQVMPQCVSTMLPGLPKEARVDFVLKMISTLLDGASADMTEKEKNDLVARALERITA
jgi:hypothetical protein